MHITKGILVSKCSYDGSLPHDQWEWTIDNTEDFGRELYTDNYPTMGQLLKFFGIPSDEYLVNGIFRKIGTDEPTLLIKTERDIK